MEIPTREIPNEEMPLPGIEPGFLQSEAGVLPLNYRADNSVQINFDLGLL